MISIVFNSESKKTIIGLAITLLLILAGFTYLKWNQYNVKTYKVKVTNGTSNFIEKESGSHGRVKYYINFRSLEYPKCDFLIELAKSNITDTSIFKFISPGEKFVLETGYDTLSLYDYKSVVVYSLKSDKYNYSKIRITFFDFVFGFIVIFGFLLLLFFGIVYSNSWMIYNGEVLIPRHTK